MPTATFDVKDLPARLDEMLALIAAGYEVVLADGGTARARLVAPSDSVSESRVGDLGAPRVLGLGAGMRIGGLGTGPGYWMADDFDAELPDSFWFGDE